ncbi:MMPL family transporter [Kroppenstedtia pulmonis]|uniref:MMPL family transporter n=1 Tax=Kroppenstedtia pulmonis TaxID=1380685 RepID=A0A7D3Y6C6_9BACL|nr:MMPL family transporter [Kroppenstedtia pulmonis]QKG85545.1 MMPL family transporter [Kroppenstedtia pulmonis]
MSRLFQPLTTAVSSQKGAKVSLIIWLVVAILISGLSFGAKKYAVNVSGGDLPDQAKSIVASKELEHYFPEEGGAPALLVFHNKDGLKSEDLKQVGEMSGYLHSDDAPNTIKESPPYHQFPEPVQQAFLSDDKTTLTLPVVLKDGLEMDDINETVTTLQKKGNSLVTDATELKITGPAGIASDTIAIFSNADVVLLLSTIGLILLLLIVIYRSPLLAVIPLLVSGLVYQVMDRFIGFAGKSGWFEIESQSLSIVSILLFAALTDYSLLVFARFREELKKQEDQYKAMQEAMKHVWEPIFFSGSTVLAAMLVLFIADYKPYQNFAPIFSITMVIILIAGLTLVPSLFALFGRKAFWPFIPKVGDPEIKTDSFWSRVSKAVVRKPGVISILLVAVLALFSLNMTQIDYSFNLIKSFPEDMNSRVGFERLEEHYSKGELAPTTVLLTSSDRLHHKDLLALRDVLEKQKGVEKVTTDFESRGALGIMKDSKIVAKDGTAARIQFIFKDNPYDQSSLNNLESMRKQSDDILKQSGMSPKKHNLHFTGETAKQADVQALNNRDTKWVILFVTLLITILLGLQTRSLVAPLYMIATILLSYGAAMGLSTFIFENILNLAEMSYRIPLYTFVFLVALGVDYNIMVVSRIREENIRIGLKEAVTHGVSMTGNVISSAGIILAATFGVLMTQPILELFMFGFTVALGILMDTFLVRGLLLPSLIVLLKKVSFWPSKIKLDEGEV